MSLVPSEYRMQPLKLLHNCCVQSCSCYLKNSSSLISMCPSTPDRFSKRLPVKARLHAPMSQRWNLRRDQQCSPFNISPMILWGVLFYCFEQRELRFRKMFLHRGFQRVDVIHSVKENELRLAGSYLRKYSLDSRRIHALFIRRS